MDAMRRLSLFALAIMGLAGCSQNEAGRKVIAEQCIADGEAIEVCECFAKEADAKLEQPMFDIVVLGAQGDDEETARLVEELDREQQAKFTTAVREVLRSCGAEGYLAGS